MASGTVGKRPTAEETAGERGAASVEQVGLIVLIGLVFMVMIAALGASFPEERGRELGSLLSRRMACAPLAPSDCRRDRLITAYGEGLGRLVRSLAPVPGQLMRGGLTGVDFRYCRRPSCAVPLAGERGDRLTTSNRRITVFTEVRRPGRGGDGSGVGAGWPPGSDAAPAQIQVIYWVYRPGQPWEAIIRNAGPAELEAAAATRLGGDETPILVPLETFPGRNHTKFPRTEEPPWRWRIAPVYPGRPS